MTLYDKPDAEKAKEVKGYYDEDKDYHYDIKGYFLIRVNKEKNRVEVGHCVKNNVMGVVVTGDKAQDIYWEVIKLGLISRLDHAAYLGKELANAFTALRENKEYVQE